MKEFDELKSKLSEADCILIGFGEEFRKAEEDEARLLKAYNNLAGELAKKNYFVLNVCDDSVIFESDFDGSRIVAPFKNLEEDFLFDRDSNPMWDKYLKWLSCTLNNKLLILELGCLTGTMQIVRWPFEKTVLLNQKSELVRVNGLCPFVPREISERSLSIKCNSVDFLL